MQRNDKCSHVYYDYRFNPMVQQTQSPNNVPKVLNNESGSSTTLDSDLISRQLQHTSDQQQNSQQMEEASSDRLKKSTDGTIMPNIVSEGYYETYDGVLDTSADDNLQQNCSVEMDIYNPRNFGASIFLH